ncbi:NAD(P)H-dependent oxidoreductase subunit E [Methylomonas koyamae]|uniref:NAD(P)H-dependent oxidoreductase subunit E n=1 Tax=Methylomonas koyamae TaxID=702114 RepID=UPI002873870C|nr:NAD(P)H-dependent oxidoreductase subunit E [Methylomonas koyamae]WNB75060.1 NAD(P)H-dependent oxidoreductase subunit E [Methylomonas koyamae]
MKTFVDKVLAQAEFQPARLLEVLRAVQAEFRHIPQPSIELIAAGLQIPRTQIIAVAEFYSFLHLEPQGRYELYIADSITDRMLGNQQVLEALAARLQVAICGVRGDGLVSLNRTACTGMCDQGPAGLINGYPLPRLTPAKIDALAALIEKQVPLNAWPAEMFRVEEPIYRPDLLLNQAVVNGSAIQASFARGLAETLAELDASHLRGRGGAGFKTALKWRSCSQQAATPRYVICNADEGEPGTFKDRMLLDLFADQVFEGMTVCAAIIGSSHGLVYLRAEYLFLRDKLLAVLEARREQGLLGQAILGRDGFDFDIEIRMGAGAYICGEASAQIESLEGKPGIPRTKPPNSVVCGYQRKPTVVDNVETFFAATHIAIQGGQWFAAVGTPQSTGTKLLSISGDCQRPGIYEYPFGTPVRTILQECGAEDVMGVQVGGPSGTFISNRELDRVVAFEDLSTAGSFMVFNRSRNLFAIAQNFTDFFAHESCGFCTPCRVGTSLLKNQLAKIADGLGAAEDLTELSALCEVVKNNSHCGLGESAANPILTTLLSYPELYLQQLQYQEFAPAFDLDTTLAAARRLAQREDPAAHLNQVEN